MELLKLLSTNEIVAQIICFLILFAILRIVLWKRVLGMIDARRETIARELRQADETKEVLEKMKADYADRVSKIDDEARMRIQKALDEAKVLAEQIRLRAEMDGDKMLQNARDSVRDELAKAKEELKDTVVDLTIKVTEKVVGEKLTEDEDRKLIEKFIEEISHK